jgi:hypothetical protein
MRRAARIVLVSFFVTGLWGQLWHALGLSPLGHRIVPSCAGGSGNPDGGCPPGAPPH